MARAGRGRDGERGVVFVFVALALTMLVAFAALAIDLGYQRLARRDAQAIADVISLDLATHLDYRTAQEIVTDPAFAVTLADSRVRNGFPSAADHIIEVAVGRVDPATRQFLEPPCAMPPGGEAGCGLPANAVEVTVRNTGVQRFFAIGQGPGSVERVSIAGQYAAGCFSLGSFALGLDPASNGILNQILGGALGTPPSLQVLGYQGLASASVGIGALATQLGLASPTELATTTVTLRDFYIAAANAMRQQDPGSVEASLLDDIVAQNAPVLATPINVGDLIVVDDGGANAAAAGTINLLDIVGGGLLLADGTHALNVSGLGVNIPGLAVATANATLIEAIRHRCGPIGTTQSTDQVRLDLTASIAGIGITVDLDAASAAATLNGVTCSQDGTQQTAQIGTTNGLGSLRVAVTPAPLPLLPPPSPINVLNASLTGQPDAVPFTVPPPLPQTQNFGQGDPSLTPNLGLLSLPVGAIVSPVITALTATVVTPLMNMVGVDVSGGTVVMEQIDCEARRLVG